MLIKDQLYALQSLEYEPDRFLKWILQNPIKFNLEKKGRLVYTNKARTLLFISALIPLVLVIIMKTSTVWMLAALTAYLLAPWLYLIPALLIIKLYEAPNRTKTINEARRVVSLNPNLIVIGITGSYGKTTVKEMLKTVLSKKYKVLSTPKSFNTLFGISQIIKEQLKPEHEIFIVEMGAYKIGEVAELCRMTRPKIGILTGISNQHLERFGSEENIIKAKYELIESLPSDGLAVINIDSISCQNLYSKTKLPKISYSHTSQADMIATDVSVSITDNMPILRFDVAVNTSTLRSIEVLNKLELKVPGEHNVGNALATIAVALYLDVPTEQVREALSEIKSPEHRLQIITNVDGTVIVDDAYSSNTDGARVAVNLVKKFTNKPKIIVTPGLVELGKAQFEENKNLGKLIAEGFDYAVIVNKTNRQPLLEGLLARGWQRQNTTTQPKLSSSDFATIALKTLENQKVVLVVDNLEEATKEVIPNLVKTGSLILFENDLPDIYE